MSLCKVCGVEVTRFIKSTNKMWDWCSNKCMGADPDILKKKQETNTKKFGSHPMHSSECREKQKNTLLEKYGVDNPSKSEEIKQRMKTSFIKKYGVDNPSKNSQVIEKIKESAIERYKHHKSEILKKRQDSCLEKYGVATNKHLHISSDSILSMKDLPWLLHQHRVLKKPCDQIAKELGVSPTPILSFLSRNGIDVTRFSHSHYETEIVSYIKSIYFGLVEENVRSIISPHELDIWIPEKKLAIEINGVYWHAEEYGKDKTYHLSKTDRCEEQGIRLIQIYDSEWKNKQEIIKSKIKHLLGNSDKVYARKCTVADVPNAEATQFLIDNHIQGHCVSKIKIGLYLNHELCAIATFGTSRFNKSAEWELLRYCSKNNSSVVGGLSRLLSHFFKTHNPQSIISYADRRWTTKDNNLYQKVEFTFTGISPPNYKYFYKNNITELFSRNQFQKHLLSAKLTVYNDKLSEYENMIANGYSRIWDCGNLIYKWNK